MPEQELTRELRELINQHLGEIDEIEVLLHLFSRKSERMDPVAVAHATRKTEASVNEHLQRLAKQGFLVRHGTEGTYSYSVRSPAVDRAVGELARLYEEQPVVLIQLLYDRPSTSVRSFADAFRIREK